MWDIGFLQKCDINGGKLTFEYIQFQEVASIMNSFSPDQSLQLKIKSLLISGENELKNAL